MSEVEPIRLGKPSLKKKSVTFFTFGSDPPPYFQPKSKCVLNDSEWLETHFKHVFEKCNKDRS